MNKEQIARLSGLWVGVAGNGPCVWWQTLQKCRVDYFKLGT